MEVTWPTLVPLGVTRPVVLRFGGATAQESRAVSETATHSTTVHFSGQAVPVPRVLVIDSYDSFVYNLVQYLGELGAEPIVVRNDQLTVQDALALAPDAVLLSPGRGRPEDAGIICADIPAFGAAGVPVLGVCLGHQAIGHVYGGSVVRAPTLMHGKTSPIQHHGQGVFEGLAGGVVGGIARAAGPAAGGVGAFFQIGFDDLAQEVAGFDGFGCRSGGLGVGRGGGTHQVILGAMAVQ